MKSVSVKCVVVVAGFLLTGCAVNYNYRDIVADVGFSGSGSVSVTVHDQRAYVLSGEKKPDFVGLASGGFGKPVSYSTLSGRPLADDMGLVIMMSLAAKGYSAVPVIVSYSDKEAVVLDDMKAAGTDRMILMTLNEWRSDLDPYGDVTLFYDLELAVYDHDGKHVAGRRIEGRESLGGDSWDPAPYARKAAPEAFKKKMEELLNSPDIAKALG